jgi:stearoyl-CoA desaturase (delta-9 desaturase)
MQLDSPLRDPYVADNSDHPISGSCLISRPIQAKAEQGPHEPGGTAVRRWGVDRIFWPHFFGIGLLHLVCLAAPFTFSWSAFAVFLVLYWAVCGLGISMGYHRLLTHRGFDTSPFVRYSLAVLGTMNFQGGPIHWVGIHRIHHRDSDTDDDPHSPRHGFLWAHILWCLAKDPLGRDLSSAAGDLKKEPGMVWLEKWFWVPQAVLGGILFLLGGWSWFVWGIAVRTVFTYHTTWLVNSASHIWGYKNFQTGDDSRNNWWVALISFGEGWHNNHHAYQRSARHGLKWFEFDPTWLSLRLLEKLRIVRNVYAAPPPAGPPVG